MKKDLAYFQKMYAHKPGYNPLETEDKEDYMNLSDEDDATLHGGPNPFMEEVEQEVEEAITNLLDNADDEGCEGMVTITNDVYIALREAFAKQTGSYHGVEVEEVEY